MNKHWKIALVLGVFGLIGGYFTAESTLNSGFIDIPDPSLFRIITIIQTGVLTFLLSWAGLWLMQRTPLSLYKRNSIIPALIMGIGVGFVIQGSDALLFINWLPELASLGGETSLNALLLGVFYGGVVEEVMMRLFLMTFTIFLFLKIKKRESLSGTYYWIAIIVTSFIFAVGHLPANIAIFGELSVVVLFRALFLNAIGGIFYGYLFWKYGLFFSVIAHMVTHIAMQLLWIPLFN
ncbi:CPBP family intramembrane metalloprotease [Halobacillus fulvus]|nr:CPBP family intramembrane metalloprotease [Halobacillus fulvus]